MNQLAPPQTAPAPVEIDASCRLPLLVLFISGAIWLLTGSVFALLASIQFHAPNFLAGSAWLTYGRIQPASANCLLYGFCLQSGLGVAFWLLACLGRTLLAQRWLVTVGAMLWNLGLTIGVAGILTGDSTGFATLELPGYATPLLWLGYLMMAFFGVFTFHQRREQTLFVSQWFLFAALFWFPWIYSTAQLLLVTFPVRGVVQSVVAWWYADNLQLVWLWLVGLGSVFYFVPKLVQRDLNSRYLALFTFWTLLLFGSWAGIPNSAPVPAWIPAASTVATVLTVLPLLALAVSLRRTLRAAHASSLLDAAPQSPARQPGALTDESKPEACSALRFIIVGAIAFLAAGLMGVLGALLPISPILGLTWFTVARTQLNDYGFFALVMFGAVYYIVPQLTGIQFPSPKLVRAHFWVALAGLVLMAAPLALAGIVEGIKLQNAQIAFMDIVKATLPFLRASTLGDLFLVLGHVLFLMNLGGMSLRFYRARATRAYEEVTEDLFKPAEVKA